MVGASGIKVAPVGLQLNFVFEEGHWEDQCRVHQQQLSRAMLKEVSGPCGVLTGVG